ncbi:MAG: PKD domain-containing protein [Deltaproteobacteria bacterium]|nr:PKD domain-containing protein [Deltaproteobacteria bacterium]
MNSKGKKSVGAGFIPARLPSVRFSGGHKARPYGLILKCLLVMGVIFGLLGCDGLGVIQRDGGMDGGTDGDGGSSDGAGDSVPPADLGMGPVAVFEATPTTGPAPLQVQFSDHSTGAGIHTWSWYFGDGQNGFEQDPLHVFESPGTYSVRLTVTDLNGSDSVEKGGVIQVANPAVDGVDPSMGQGGSIAPGQTGDWSSAHGSGHVFVYVSANYDGTLAAAPVIWLFNEEIPQWRGLADEQGLILVDLDEYNDVSAYVAKINFASGLLEERYNVDRARYHLAGWSAGGNIVVILGAQNQDFAASTLAFPGTGGQGAYDDLSAWSGHKIRLFYACGEDDPNFPWSAVQNEADVFGGLGYQTRFQMVPSCGHYIDEDLHHIRRDAWNWVSGFNLQN